MSETLKDKRAEPRTILDQYHSVEMSFKSMENLYQFKIWDISSKGMCILVKETSHILNYIRVGETLDMKYYTRDPAKPPRSLRTEIRHITKDDQGRFKGHYLVGLSILEEKNTYQGEHSQGGGPPVGCSVV